jgi:phytanoyl-CoA hydroxylase
VDEPTPAQIDQYRRDGFLIVERFLDTDTLDDVRDRFAAVFEHEWETGLAPDEVNYTPGVTAPELTRQMCNVWKADRVLAAVTLAERVGRWASALAGMPGARVAQDNAIWKPPSGKALLCHQDAAYLEWLDPPNMTTCWIALDDTTADGGTIYYVAGSHHWPPPVPSLSSCRSRCRPAAPPSTTAGPSTAARSTSALTHIAARSSAT